MDWVHALRVLVLSAAGFAVGVGAFLGPKYVRYSVAANGGFVQIPKGRGLVAITCGTLALVIANVGMAVEILERLDEPMTWRTPAYLAVFLLLDVMLVILGLSVRDANKKGK
jgi:hypothetical protein